MSPRLAMFFSILVLVPACTPPPPPNVFLIVIDTARADRFSCYGHERETTPNIDALAKDGVLYTRAHSAAPWTLPAHASIFTGHWPGEHGLNWSTTDASGDLGGDRGRPVARQQGRLLAEVLRDRGYSTVGITNNGWVSPRSGLDAGFQQFTQIYQSIKEVRRQYQTWPEECKVPVEVARMHGGMSVALFKHTHLQGLPAPFFAFFNVNEPHFPYNARGEFRGRFGGDPALIEEMGKRGGEMERALLAGAETTDAEMLRTCYDEELLAVDAVLGELFRWLKERELYDSALIIVTSDHGELLGEGGRYSHQLAVSRELLQVPLIVKYPGNRDAGTREDHPLISTVDIYQTILSAAAPGHEDGDGATWSQDLADLEGFERTWTMSEYYYSDSYLDGLGRVNPDFDKEPHRAVRRVMFTDQGRLEFRDQDGADGAEIDPALLEMVRRYDRTVAELEPVYRGDVIEDDASLEQLREHGYIE